ALSTIQWYVSNSPFFGVVSATKIEGANATTYNPPASNVAGILYYYVRITDQCNTQITLRSKVTSTQAHACVLDQDGDGYYTGNVVMACSSPGSGYVVKSTQLPGDCVDNNDAIKPGATEVRDLIDNNCDGNIDEGLPPIDLPASPTNLTTTTPGVTD